MLGPKPDKEWEKFGKKDPYYGVMTQDRFRKEKLDKKALVEFFTSGREHIEYIMDTIRTCIQPDFSPTRSLDFGCGVGRCAIPLASICPDVVGVDISDSMLEEGRRICIERSVTNLEFVRSGDGLSNVPGKFDLIHSSFVFQHISRNRGEKIFKRLIELLSENGIAVLQFLIHREVSTAVEIMGQLRKNVPLFNNFANLLYGKPFFEPLMEKNVYDLNRILKILHEAGYTNFHLRLFRNGNHLDTILFFQKRQDGRVPHESFFKDSDG